ncbi:MAG: CcmD family protein [Chitinophagaceae bacterium]|nr:CcmD family protein [Chitinophagaceae bacterium]
MKKLGLLVSALCLSTFSLLAQNKNAEMADVMRSNGKIYVVVAVIITIFAGLVIYLIRLDNKITRLEKELTNQNS